jgi:transcriptional regulator with XRE-family HTH domain
VNESLETYIRARAKDLDLNLSEVCRHAGISRQTLYSLSDASKLPALSTLVALADVLQVHPLRLLQLIFDELPAARTAARRQKRGDISAFGRDVTFPDGALVLPGERFVKTWELQNVGKVVWENRCLVCMDEEISVYARSGEILKLANNLIPSADRVPVPTTLPGQTVQLSVEFTAPESQGTVLSYWKTTFADGTLCFPKRPGLWAKVRVSTLASAAAEERGEG